MKTQNKIKTFAQWKKNIKANFLILQNDLETKRTKYLLAKHSFLAVEGSSVEELYIDYTNASFRSESISKWLMNPAKQKKDYANYVQSENEYKPRN